MTFTADDLPAGRYKVLVYSPSRRAEGRPDAIMNEVLSRTPLTLNEGERATVAVNAPAP